MRVTLAMQLTRLSKFSAHMGHSFVLSTRCTAARLRERSALRGFRPTCRLQSTLPTLSSFIGETEQRGYARSDVGSVSAYYAGEQQQQQQEAAEIGEVDWSSDIVNSVSLVGRTSRAFELRSVGTTVVANCSLAVSVRKDQTEWFEIEVWGALAEAASQSVEKGTQIRVLGRLKLNEWTDREGNPRKSFKVSVTALQRVRKAAFARPPSQEPYYNKPMSDGWEQAQAPWDPLYPDQQDSPPPYRRYVPDDAYQAATAAARGGQHMMQAPPERQAAGQGSGPADKWSRFIESPHDYYDNRSDKRNPRAPDFKHKVNHEALWLNGKDTPPGMKEWVVLNLPAPTPSQ
eukprot:jgi/Botrbrau1/11873/Bobra.126_2s0008.1